MDRSGSLDVDGGRAKGDASQLRPVSSDGLAVPGRPLNLLAFIHFHRLLNQTGVGRVTYELLDTLSHRQEIALHALGSSEDHASLVSAGFGLPAPVSTHLFPRSRTRQQAMWAALQRPKAEHYWADAEIVWCPAESYVPTAKARLIVTLHDAAHLEPGVRRPRTGVALQRFKWRWMMQRLQSDAAAFVTVSKFSAERLLYFYPWMKDRIWVVPNAVPRRFLLPPGAEGDAAVSRLSLAGKRMVFVPGGLAHQKNGSLILAAWQIIRRCRNGLSLVVAGKSEDELSAQCRSLCPEVRLLGYVSDEELRSLYAQADVVWFPSLYEGFGMPVLEGMASGKPVVCCSAGAIPEVAGDAALLLPTDAPAQHAEAILALLEDSGMRRNYVERGLQRAMQLSWNASADRLIEVFHNALGTAGSRTCRGM